MFFVNYWAENKKQLHCFLFSPDFLFINLILLYIIRSILVRNQNGPESSGHYLADKPKKR